jgi:hypothetical protein
MALKGTDSLFAFKEYSHKNFKGKKVLCKNSPEFSFQIGSKMASFNGIKNRCL